MYCLKIFEFILGKTNYYSVLPKPAKNIEKMEKNPVARKEMNDARTSSTKFGSVKRSRYAPHHFCRFVIVTSEIRLILAPNNWPKLHRWSTCIIYFFPSNMLQQFGVFFILSIFLAGLAKLRSYVLPKVDSKISKYTTFRWDYIN